MIYQGGNRAIFSKIPAQNFSIKILQYLFQYFRGREPGFSVGIATGYGMDGPGIQSPYGRDFPHLSKPALEAHTASFTMGKR
jgi:hypothetical protein